MSPLACSLLALGALLAAADAMTNPFCSGLSRGKTYGNGISSERFVIHARGDEVTIIPDRCSRPGRQLVGDLLSVCNTPHNQPKLSTPMGIQNPLGAVYISCPLSVPGCSNLELEVTQYGEIAGTAPLPPSPAGGVLG